MKLNETFKVLWYISFQSSSLKRHMKGEKVKNSMQGSGDLISKTFMMALVKLIGKYWKQPWQT